MIGWKVQKKKKTTNYEICLIEKSGHFPMLEKPQEWLQCVLKK